MNSDYMKSTVHGESMALNHVLVLENENSRQTIILEEANYSIGRDNRNKIILPSKKVSRFHATLLRRTDTKNHTFSYWLLDGDLQGNRSTNGIFINDKRCLVQELKHEDVIRLGFEVQASYYILNNVADIALLQSGDFGNLSDLDSTVQSKEKRATDEQDQESLVILESNLEAFPQQAKETTLQTKESTPKSDLKKLASFPELSPHPIFELNEDGKVTYINPSGMKAFPDLITEQSQDQHPLLVNVVKHIKNNAASNQIFSREVQIKSKTFDQYAYYLPNKQLIRSYIFETFKRNDNNTSDSGETKYQTLLNQTKEGVFLIDPQSKTILNANEALCSLLGYSLEEILSLKLYDLIDLNTASLDKQIQSILKSPDDNQLLKQFSYKCKNKLFIDLESSVSRISEQNKTLLSFLVYPHQRNNYQETIVQEEGLFDLQTGLPNRQLFHEQLKIAIANSQRHKGLLCLTFVELEILEENEDILSHELKGKIREGFAKRLQACLRSGDTISYWESAQFVCLFPQIISAKDAGRISSRMLESLSKPFFIDNKKIQTQISIGLALKIKEDKSADELISEAQNALLQSKEAGSNNYKFSQSQLQNEIERLLRIEKLLAHALERNEFSLVYQPQIDLQAQKITGIEALIRWHHPDLGTISPDQFIPLAEETGLMIAIGQWVLETACHQRKIWQQEYNLQDQPICINISSSQFQQHSFVGLLESILDKTQLEPRLLELELTESTLAQDLELSDKNLDQINNLGVRCALDDFGTGVSSLAYLKRFQFASLKIDQPMVNDVSNNPQDKALLNSLVDIANGLNLRVIAEAVEESDKIQELVDLGCNQAQGNCLESPLPEEKINQLLTSAKYS